MAEAWAKPVSSKQIGVLVVVGLVTFIGLQLVSAPDKPRSTDSTSAPVGPESFEIQAGLDQCVPGLQAVLAEGGGTLEAEVRKGDARVRVTVPLMTEPEATEIALMVAQRLTIPSGTFWVVEVYSPAGQSLARVMDRRL